MEPFAREMFRLTYRKFRFLQVLEFNFRARRDSTASRGIAKRLGYLSLDRRTRLFPHPAATKTLFILATGSSSRLLEEDEFSVIRRGHSIGVNRWLVADFVPDAVSLDSSKIGAAEHANRDIRSFLGVRMEHVARQRPDVKVLLLRPPPPSHSIQYYPIPKDLRSSVFVYGRANVVGLNETSAERELRLLVEAKGGYCIPNNMLVDNGSSVVRLIFFGISQKYEHIVLVGVDADDGPYFYADRPELGNSIELADSGLHTTETVAERPLPTSVFIRKLAQAMRNVGGPKLWVGSKESRLSDELPVFDWSA